MSDVTDATPVSKDEQNWAMGCHLAALSGFVIPFGNLVGPLAVWLIKRGEMPMVDRHGKEVLNFQITVVIAAAIGALLCLILIGFLLLPILYVGALILTIIAAVKVSNGDYDYRYPLTLRFLK